MARNSWGSVRKLPSGKFQARYCIDYVWHTAPSTFRTKKEADSYLAGVRADLDRGVWLDPGAGKVSLADYSVRWIRERPQLRPRTVELYEGLLRNHINPALGATQINQLTSARVRDWRATMLRSGKPGASAVAKCYRLLHAIFATAVEDGLVPRNPCIIKGASIERPAERPVASIAQVFEIAGDSRRRQILGAFGRLSIAASVYVTDYRRGDNEEPARQRCLDAMLADMEALQVAIVVLDTRGPARDAEDRRTISRAIREGSAPQGKTFAHRGSRDEFLLGLPDAIGWADGAGGRYSALIDTVTTRVILP